MQKAAARDLCSSLFCCVGRFGMLSALLWVSSAEKYFYICGSETPAGVSEALFHGEKLLTEATPSVKMRLSRPAGRDKREISIGIPLKNGQSEAETIKIVLRSKRMGAPAQNRPVILPSASTSMFTAAGFLGRPGMVMHFFHGKSYHRKQLLL